MRCLIICEVYKIILIICFLDEHYCSRKEFKAIAPFIIPMIDFYSNLFESPYRLGVCVCVSVCVGGWGSKKPEPHSNKASAM